MLQAVHSEQGVASGEPGGGAAVLEAFGPFLRLAMDDAALPGSMAALPAPGGSGARAVAALGRGPERFSAAGHWASESLARARGQKLGVNLAEIAAGELASPAEPGAAIAADPAPGREPAARWSSDSSLPREHGRGAPGGEGAGRSAADAPSADADDGEPAPVTPGADRSAGRGQSGGHAGVAAAGRAAAAGGGGGGIAPAPGSAQGAGQIQGPSGPISPVSASAWKLEPAGRAAGAARTPGAGGSAPSQSSERAVQTQMERGLGAVLRQGGGSLTLKLAPASLGEVRIQMTLEGGAVRARFEAASGEARELMAAGLGALRAALEARGLRVESLEVAPESHERAERPVAEPSRSEPEGRQGEQGGQTGRGGDRGEAGGGSAADAEGGEGGEGRHASPESGAGRGESDGALEDPAIMHTAGELSETLVSLRLDTVA